MPKRISNRTYMAAGLRVLSAGGQQITSAALNASILLDAGGFPAETKESLEGVKEGLVLASAAAISAMMSLFELLENSDEHLGDSKFWMDDNGKVHSTSCEATHPLPDDLTETMGVEDLLTVLLNAAEDVLSPGSDPIEFIEPPVEDDNPDDTPPAGDSFGEVSDA